MDVLSPSQQPNNNPPAQNFGTTRNIHISCPYDALKFYTQNLYLFLGLSADFPNKAREYEPIILDFRRKIKSLEDLIGANHRILKA